MVRIILASLLAMCITAHAADHRMRLSDLPSDVQDRILEAIRQDGDWTQLAELTASDGTTSDAFGVAVAIDGDTVVVGAPNATVGQNQQEGAAYVFVKPSSGWENMTQKAKLTCSVCRAYEHFGQSVAISGSTIVIEGAVYEKPKGGWRSGSETTVLLCGEAAISGNTIVCGYGSNYTALAAVYVRPKAGWKSVKTYTALLQATGVDDPFSSLAIDRGVVVAGDIYYNNQAGSAYVFVEPRGGWGHQPNVLPYQTQTATLTASDGNINDFFGWSVAVHGETIAVGAIGNYGGACDALYGAAYVFVKPASGWQDMTQTAELGDSSIGEYGNFGYAVAVQGNTLVVGDMLGDNADNHQGLADVFLEPQGGWADTCSPNATLSPSNGQESDQFGIATAVSGSTLVIGSNYSNIGQKGAAYVFGP